MNHKRPLCECCFDDYDTDIIEIGEAVFIESGKFCPCCGEEIT